MRFWVLSGAFALLCAHHAGAIEFSSFHVGNSLTIDSRYWELPRTVAESNGYDTSMGGHILCGSSLTQMIASPTATCVAPGGFGYYADALANNTWDAVTLQPYSNSSTLKSEVDSILAMIDIARSNPGNADTTFFIYQGWTTRDNQAGWEQVVIDADDTAASLSRGFMQLVFDRVTAQTDVDVQMIYTGETMFQLGQMIDDGDVSPFGSHNALYRDNDHASYWGNLVASSLMYEALFDASIPPSMIDPNFAPLRAAIDSVVIPEPGSGMLLGLVMLAGLSRRQHVR